MNLLTDFLNMLQYQKLYSPNTVSAYRIDIVNLLSFFNLDQNNLSLNDIKELNMEDIKKWVANRKTNNTSSRSISRAISANKSFFKFIESKYNTKLSISDIKGVKFKVPLYKAVNKDIVNNLIDYVQTIHSDQEFKVKRDQLILKIMFIAGMRISETLNMRYKDYDSIKHNGCVTIFGKGGKERVIPMTAKIIQDFTDYIKLLKVTIDPDISNDSYIFVENNNKKLYPRYIQLLLEKLRNNFNLPTYLTPHALRHSCATNLLLHNANIRQIQTLLGHASLSTTQNYLKISKQHLSNKLKKIGWE